MDNLSTAQWRRVKEIAAAAFDLEPAERTAYVARACAEDEDLRDEVSSLLESADAATPFFETPGGGASARLDATGSRLGPYRVIQELATGGMGTVYLAARDDGEFNQRVAIKIVRGGFASSVLLDRFRAERRILASLEHPNIARLLDGGATETGLPYVVMEFVEGEPIDRFCSRHQLPLRDRLTIFHQVCGAVQYAHQHLVIHRDIKAPNILVAADGTPKLLDFGIAKLLDPETGVERPTHTTMHVMTPESASPEQIRGTPVGVAADVYALGVLLYRLLTEQSPYRSALNRGVDLTRAVCEEPPDRPSAHASGLTIPADLDTIVLKALRKEPDRRYGSVEQLAQDIQRFLDGRPVLASPDSLRYRTRKFIGRHRVAVTGATALAVAIAGGVTATVWQARVANRERVHAQREFDAVRGLATAMLVELSPAVDKLPGSIAAREIIIRRGTEYLDTLAAEASGDDELRREVAQGYIHLAIVQGSTGMPNIGDQKAALQSLRKVVALLGPLVHRPAPAAQDRLYLASTLATLAQESTPAEGGPLLTEAHALLDTLSPAERSTPFALSIRQSVWASTANIQVARNDFEGARASRQQFLEAAEELLRQKPNSLDASRNLSIAYKNLGATLEMLNRRPEAVALYGKALDLDQRRVAADPAGRLWRLDLSFSYGAIGAALAADDDFEGARDRYEQAVALREQVVKEDPNEDFAKLSLARGYDRLAVISTQLGQAGPALEYSAKARAVYRERLRAHPERDNVWHDFTSTSLGSIDDLIALAPKSGRDGGRQIARAVGPMLDELQDVKDRWTRGGHAGDLPPSLTELRAYRARLVALR